MSLSDIQALGDYFTKNLLLEGKYPLSLRDLINAIASVTGDHAFPDRRMFLVAEGGQVRLTEPAFELNARLVFTWQRDSASPAAILLSTVADLDSEDALLQLIAWSEVDGAFHFFERRNGAWAWAGNSFHALFDPTRGKGPFDSHINGGLVMKELKAPWGHWHSMSASIPREVFEPDSQFNTQPLFRDIRGAEQLEAIVRTGIVRWTKSRMITDIQGGRIGSLGTYLKQVLTPTSANLTSSLIEYHRVMSEDVGLPTSFFFDIDALEHLVFKLDPSSTAVPAGKLMVRGDMYKRSADALGLHLRDTGSALLPGDTHFCFKVPERAFEDLAVVKEIVARGVMSARLMACLLMVDFHNPLWSSRREALLQHWPNEAQLDGNSTPNALETAFIDRCRHQASEGSPETEFLSYWDADDLLNRIGSELRRFFQGVQETIRSPDGVDRLMLLAETRKRRFRKRDLDEFESTLSRIPESSEASIDKYGQITITTEIANQDLGRVP